MSRKWEDSKVRKFSWLQVGFHTSENTLKPYSNVAIRNISTSA